MFYPNKSYYMNFNTYLYKFGLKVLIWEISQCLLLILYCHYHKIFIAKNSACHQCPLFRYGDYRCIITQEDEDAVKFDGGPRAMCLFGFINNNQIKARVYKENLFKIDLSSSNEKINMIIVLTGKDCFLWYVRALGNPSTLNYLLFAIYF